MAVSNNNPGRNRRGGGRAYANAAGSGSRNDDEALELQNFQMLQIEDEADEGARAQDEAPTVAAGIFDYESYVINQDSFASIPPMTNKDRDEIIKHSHTKLGKLSKCISELKGIDDSDLCLEKFLKEVDPVFNIVELTLTKSNKWIKRQKDMFERESEQGRNSNNVNVFFRTFNSV